MEELGNWEGEGEGGGVLTNEVYMKKLWEKPSFVTQIQTLKKD